MQNLFWGFVLIAFGIVMFLDNMGYADITEIIENFWPLILIFLGISILMKRNQTQNAAFVSSSETQPQPGFQGDLIHESNVFGEVVMTLSSQNFKGGSVSTLFGEIRLDLSRVRIAEGTHELRIKGVFGSATIIMPKDAGYAVFSSTVLGSQSILGQRKEGISTSLQTFSSHQATATNRLSVMISQTFGEVRLEESLL